MVFGYMVVQRLLVLVRVFSRLPDAASRVFARSLNAAITPFNIINYYGNYYGSCAAALVYNRHRMGAKMDRVIASLHLRAKATTACVAACVSRHGGTRSSRTT